MMAEMKKLVSAVHLQDLLFCFGLAIVLLVFILFEPLNAMYKALNSDHGIIMSFIKFAVLATTGEVLGVRIKRGFYRLSGFGLVPRALVWGFLGMTIHMAFVVFSVGTPAFLEYLGVHGSKSVLHAQEMSFFKVLLAFAVSVTMNLIYAPVMMTMHKITDAHIEHHGGSLTALVRPIQVGNMMAAINWQVQWHFVFKKTIPLFWIPAHTVTFLLPPAYRVLFAAMLGILLGVILAVASVKGRA
jgi:hypothetical protein